MYSEIIEIIKNGELKPLLMEGTSSHLYGYTKACKDLGVRCEKNGNHFLIKSPHDNSYIGVVSGMVSSFVSYSAIRIANDKVLTNKLLRANGVNVPKQYAFELHEKGKAREIFKLHKLRVVKPSNGAGGKGITVGVGSLKEFDDAFDYAAQNIGAKGKVVLEKRIEGFDARVIVVNGKFDCAVSRIPAYVIGDGKSTIKDLVEEKNILRAQHPHHKAFPIELNDIKNDSQLILEEDEIFYINGASNIHLGGEAVDITDFLSPQIKNLAVRAAKSIPGLNVTGVDFQLKNLTDDKSAYVLELNTSANFGIHYYPYYGKQRNPALAIIKDLISL